MGVQVDHEKMVISFWFLVFGKSRLWFGVIGVSSFWLSESIRNLNYPKISKTECFKSSNIQYFNQKELKTQN
jgi:hypothetical protein